MPHRTPVLAVAAALGHLLVPAPHGDRSSAAELGGVRVWAGGGPGSGRWS
ncbi:hypothetical protein ABZ470_34845 [Streptosporangium sp. NPDC020072]